MEMEEYVAKARDLAKASPMQGEVSTELVIVQSGLENLYQECHHPLRLVLMGAVKSGKSTLLNTLVGRIVSPVGVSETTSTIIRIEYSLEESAEIVFMDKTCYQGTPIEIFQLLEEHRRDQAYFSRCREVCIRLPLKELCTIEIIDTPGVATLTENNEQRTHDYIQKADVVLWVLHGDYLGQSSISKELNWVQKFGKPVIAVISHIDDKEEENDVIAYVKDEMPNKFQEIFTFSGKKAQEALQAQDDTMLAASGYTKLMSYLVENIDRNSDEVQVDSLLDSVKKLLNQNRDMHQMEYDKWGEQAEILRNYITCLEAKKWQICKYMMERLQFYIRQDFLTKEYDAFCIYLNGIHWPLQSVDKEGLESELKKVFANQNIYASVEKIMADLEKEFRVQWQRAMDEFSATSMVQQGGKRFAPVQQGIDMREEKGNLNFSSMIGTVGKTTAATAVLGTGISAYAAGIGTYAAHLSMAGALGSFMPPLLLAGAVIGTFINWRGHSEKIGQLRSDLYSDIEKRRKVLLDQLNDVFEEQVKCLSDEIINNVRESISQENFQMEYKDIWQYIQALQKYCRQVEQLLADAPEYKVVLSEVRDRLQATIDEQEELLKKTKGDYSIDSSQQMQDMIDRLNEEKRALEEKCKQERQVYQKELEQAENLSAHGQRKLEEKIKKLENETHNYRIQLDSIVKKVQEAQKETSQMRMALAEKEEKLKKWQQNTRDKFNEFLSLGGDIDDSEYLDNGDIWEKMTEVFRPLAERMKSDDTEGFIAFKVENQKQYERFDEKTIDFLSTGDFLYYRLNKLQNVNLDISTAILEYCKAVERVMHQLLDVDNCGMWEICKKIKKNAAREHWKNDFVNKLHEIRKYRNQIAHVETIDPENVRKVRWILFAEEYEKKPGYGMMRYLHDRYER